MITVNSTINLARSEVGYLEKASNAELDNPTKNAGTNNFTKYSRDLVKGIGAPYANGVAWCDIFFDWLFFKQGGKKGILDNIYGYSAYTPTSAKFYKDRNRYYRGTSPKPGYQIFFKNSSRICHTGLVIDVRDGLVFTVEGNTSSAPGVVPNGGCVREKSYSVSYKNIDGYGIPAYFDIEAPLKPEEKKFEVTISDCQKFLNLNYFDVLKIAIGGTLQVDGDWGKFSRHATLAVWKNLMNKKYNKNLTLTNSAFGTSCKLAANNAKIKFGTKNEFVYVLEIMLRVLGFYTGKIDGDCGIKLCTAIRDFEVTRRLLVDSNDPKKCSCGVQVWFAVFN